MTPNLMRNLCSKRELRFSRDGKFRILMMSDIQETLSYDGRTLDGMHRLTERVSPDLVILGGDNCSGPAFESEEEFRAYLDIFSAPMESRGIPWAHVFGNHDHDLKLDDLVTTRLYERYEHCVSKHTEDIHGTTNFVLPILSSDGDEIAFNVWGLDTGNKITETDIPYDTAMKGMRRPPNASYWDILHFDQLMWYWNSSAELEAHCGKRIDGIMFMHIAPWEFQYIVDNPDLTGGSGSTVEHMNLGAFNSGIFAAVLQRKDIRCIACGHSHKDSFQGSLCGVTMCLDACAGYSPYGIDEIRGGRCFEIDEKSGDINTYMVHYSEL